MIERNGIYDAYKVRVTASGGTRVCKNQEHKMPVIKDPDSGVDVIEISPEATLKAQTDAIAKQYAAKNTEVSQARLDRLRQQYAGGQCPISAEATAQAILDRLGI